MKEAYFVIREIASLVTLILFLCTLGLVIAQVMLPRPLFWVDTLVLICNSGVFMGTVVYAIAHIGVKKWWKTGG